VDVPVDWDVLQRSWNEQQPTYLLDRDERFAPLLDDVETDPVPGVCVQRNPRGRGTGLLCEPPGIEAGLVWGAGADAVVVGVKP
jgi:hypothetical protein